jgi:hypothetical protein
LQASLSRNRTYSAQFNRSVAMRQCVRSLTDENEASSASQYQTLEMMGSTKKARRQPGLVSRFGFTSHNAADAR